MAHQIPALVPIKITAGDTATWKISLSDYPADDGWTLAYALVQTGSKITFSSSSLGADHLISESPSVTSAWAAGVYAWQSRVSKDAESYTVGRGSVEILTAFDAAGGGFDGHSHAKKTLAALEAWIESRSPGVAKYQLAGRTMEYWPIPDLLVFRDKYRCEVRQEENAARLASGLPSKNIIRVRG